MAVITVQHLSEEVHRALLVRAAHHGRTLEAEVCDILEKAVKPEGRLMLGSLLMSIAHEAGGLSDAEAEQFLQPRGKPSGSPLQFD